LRVRVIIDEEGGRDIIVIIAVVVSTTVRWPTIVPETVSRSRNISKEASTGADTIGVDRRVRNAVCYGVVRGCEHLIERGSGTALIGGGREVERLLGIVCETLLDGAVVDTREVGSSTSTSTRLWCRRAVR